MTALDIAVLRRRPVQRRPVVVLSLESAQTCRAGAPGECSQVGGKTPR